MTLLYAATGDAIARLGEADGEWAAALTLRGSGAQCLSTDPADPRRRENVDRLRAPGGGGVLARGEPRGRGRLRRNGAERALPQRRWRPDVARAAGTARAPLTPDLELPAPAV